MEFSRLTPRMDVKIGQLAAGAGLPGVGGEETNETWSSGAALSRCLQDLDHRQSMTEAPTGSIPLSTGRDPDQTSRRSS